MARKAEGLVHYMCRADRMCTTCTEQRTLLLAQLAFEHSGAAVPELLMFPFCCAVLCCRRRSMP